MDRFDPSLFTELREQWRLRESALVDLKSHIPQIAGDVHALAEFVRDMIAFANTARRRGKQAYILYGIDNAGNLLPNGIKGQCTRAELPDGWDDEDPSKFDRQQNEVIGRDMHNRISTYVMPSIDFDYVPGLVEGKLVSYVVIWPSPTSTHFEVKRKLTDKRTGEVLLRRRQCWIREGESKREVIGEEKRFLYSWREVPYIERNLWVQHLDTLARDFEAKDVDWEREVYIPLTGGDSSSSFPLEERIEQFLDAPITQESVLLLTGKPGAGKTNFLYRLVHRLADVARQSAELSRSEQPEVWIPVFFDLNRYVPVNVNVFIRDLALSLDRYSLFGLNTVSSPERILTDRNLRFLVCLDAFDEEEEVKVTGDKARIIRAFLQEFPNLKVIIASRPYVLPPRWLRQYAHVSITPLTDEDILAYLSTVVKQPYRLFDFLSADEDLLMLMRTPLMLRIAVEYWQPLDEEATEESEIIPQPTKGTFVHHLFSRLFEHEQEKRLTRDRELRAIAQRESLSELALWMDGRYRTTTLERARQFLGDALLELQNLGIIEIQEDRLGFCNELAHAYFAALALSRLIETRRCGQLLAALKLNRNYSFWSKCFEILQDLTSANIQLLIRLLTLIRA